MKLLLLMLFLFSVGISFGQSAPCSTSEVLLKIRPRAAWVMQGDSVKTLRWLDKKQSRPSENEVEKARQVCASETAEREAQKAQARLDVKNPATPTDKKLQQLILLLDLDK